MRRQQRTRGQRAGGSREEADEGNKWNKEWVAQWVRKEAVNKNCVTNDNYMARVAENREEVEAGGGSVEYDT